MPEDVQHALGRLLSNQESANLQRQEQHAENREALQRIDAKVSRVEDGLASVGARQAAFEERIGAHGVFLGQTNTRMETIERRHEGRMETIEREHTSCAKDHNARISTLEDWKIRGVAVVSFISLVVGGLGSWLGKPALEWLLHRLGLT